MLLAHDKNPRKLKKKKSQKVCVLIMDKEEHDMSVVSQNTQVWLC